MPASGVRARNASRTSPTGRSRCAASPSATPPNQRPRTGRRSGSRRGATRGAVAVHAPIVTRPPPLRGASRGRFRAARPQVQGALRGHPMPRGPPRRPGSRHGHEHSPHTGATGTPPRRPTRPTASSPRSAASASRVPTTAGSPASAPASPTGSASTRCWSAAIFAASLLLGGLGLVVYGVAWALLPERRDGRIHAEEMILGRFDIALLGALAFVLVGLGRGDTWFFFWGLPGGSRGCCGSCSSPASPRSCSSS